MARKKETKKKATKKKQVKPKAETQGKWLKYIIRSKRDKTPICGVRYDAEKREFLIGGPATMEAERKKLILMLDLNLQRLEDEVKEDGFRSRVRVPVSERTWKSFKQRASVLYLFEEVTSFKRLMG